VCYRAEGRGWALLLVTEPKPKGPSKGDCRSLNVCEEESTECIPLIGESRCRIVSTDTIMSFSEIRSFLISRRIGSGRAFLPSKEHARIRTVPRFCDEGFLRYEPIPIAFGCSYQGMPKLLFRRVPRRPRGCESPNDCCSSFCYKYCGCRRFCDAYIYNHCDWSSPYSCCGCDCRHLSFYCFYFRHLCPFYCRCCCECCYTFCWSEAQSTSLILPGIDQFIQSQCDEVPKCRKQALLDMLKVNTMIHTIHIMNPRPGNRYSTSDCCTMVRTTVLHAAGGQLQFPMCFCYPFSSLGLYFRRLCLAS
jgi:hypothetical protein